MVSRDRSSPRRILGALRPLLNGQPAGIPLQVALPAQHQQAGHHGSRHGRASAKRSVDMSRTVEISSRSLSRWRAARKVNRPQLLAGLDECRRRRASHSQAGPSGAQCCVNRQSDERRRRVRRRGHGTRKPADDSSWRWSLSRSRSPRPWSPPGVVSHPYDRPWPSYQITLSRTRPRRVGSGADRSLADSNWAITSLTGQETIEDTIGKLNEVSENALVSVQRRATKVMLESPSRTLLLPLQGIMERPEQGLRCGSHLNSVKLHKRCKMKNVLDFCSTWSTF